MTTYENTDIARALILHCGSHRVTRAQVATVKAPPPTETHFPIAHEFLIGTVLDALTTQGFTVTGEAHALYGDGVRYFGALALKRPDASDGHPWSHVLGLRNSFDKSFSPQGMLGTFMPFICDNLAWSGGNIFRFARKATRYVARDLSGVVHERIGTLQQRCIRTDSRMAQYQTSLFEGENEDYAFLIRAMKARAVAASRLDKVLFEWERPDGPAGAASRDPMLNDRSCYRMLNAFTAVERDYPTMLEGPRRNARLTSLLDAHAQITVDAQEELAEVE